MPDPIIQVALDLSASIGAQDRYRRLLSSLRTLMPSDAAMITRLEDGVLRPIVFDGLRESVLDLRFPLTDYPVLKLIASSDTVVRVSGGEVRKFRFYAEDSAAGDKPMAVMVGAALRVEGKVVGTLTTSAADAHAFDEVEDETIMAFAALAAAALRTAELIDALEEAAQHRQRVAVELQRDARKRVAGPLLGESDAVRRLREEVKMSAATTDTLLILGAAGAGKEAVARAIHDESSRRENAFIYVNCAQLESESEGTLFGTARRLIDAATESDSGKFDLAAGGTIYLDGVERLTMETQAELLRLLNQLDAIRERGEVPDPDVRVIAATADDPGTSRRLLEALGRSLGRRTLVAPRLADRREDLPSLVEHFVRLHERRLGKEAVSVSDESMERLCKYGWPGDIQELSNVIESALVASHGTVLEINTALLEEGIALGSYRLIERLGEGGMGEVWKARHRLLARPAAVKLIRAEALDKGDRVVERFQREAQATANLRSPHTVQLFDFGVSDTGAFYYVMELLDGLDLDQLVKKFGPVSPERAAGFLIQACRSLGEANELGIVHRDIKPANLYVCRLGIDCDFLKVLDFGMVTAVAEDEARLTMEGVARGTPAFMPPELALGEANVDGRADLYSLGCVAYWLLTGHYLFDANSATRLLMHHVQTPPTPLSQLAEQDIPPRLEELVMSCLEKSPANRPASATELGEALEAIEFRTPWTQERARKWWTVHMPEVFRREPVRQTPV